MIVEFDVEEQGFVNKPKIAASNLKKYFSALSQVLIKDSHYYRLITTRENVALLGLGKYFF